MNSNITEKSIKLKLQFQSEKNKKINSENYADDITEYRKHMDEIYKNFPNKPDNFLGFFL